MSLMTGAKLLVGASCLGFLVGLYFPVMVLLEPGPSVTAYGIVLVSFPAWALGVLSAGWAAYLVWRAGRITRRLERFSWLIGSLNLVAMVLCLVRSPAGVS